MAVSLVERQLTYQERLDALRAKKMEFTYEKQKSIGYMDFDDHAIILPPPEYRELAETKDADGKLIRDPRTNIKGVKFEDNYPGGGFWGPKACGRNLRTLLEHHPPYIDPMSSLAGAYMVDFAMYGMRTVPPGLDYSHLHEEQSKYHLVTGIGAAHHNCQDFTIGFELGWGGLLDKIRHYRQVNSPNSAEFYGALEDVVLGIQNWIQRNADESRKMARTEENPQLRENLLEMADINDRLVSDPPKTFREAVQWIIWYQMVGRIHNGNGSLGRLDVLLQPFYDREIAAGTLTDDEATFHVACMLLRETGYIQIGGLDENGNDVATPLSYDILEAAHNMKIPCNVSVCVGEGMDQGLVRRGVEIMFEDKMGIPRFLGIENTAKGFTKFGFPLSLARQRNNAGCHWYALPGIEYTLNDVIKVSFGGVFDVALREMMADQESARSTSELWDRFVRHLKRSVEVLAEGIDIQLEHYHEAAPELIMDLLCHGTIERGLDISHGGVDLYNIGVDGAALAVVADSFAAVEQRIGDEQQMTWDDLLQYLDTNWAGTDGECARLMMQSVPRYGSGGSRADDWAVRISQTFSEIVVEKQTPEKKANMVPGLFSWANTIGFGQMLGATPNGRRAKEPISHGANPLPGFRQDGALTAMATAIASVQCGYGAAAPMQIEVEPALSKEKGGVDLVVDLISTHVALGGTQINMNVVDKEKIIEAHNDPSKYPDLTVRATGFSVYFSSLSPDFRQLIVNRILKEA